MEIRKREREMEVWQARKENDGREKEKKNRPYYSYVTDI